MNALVDAYFIWIRTRPSLQQSVLSSTNALPSNVCLRGSSTSEGHRHGLPKPILLFYKLKNSFQIKFVGK